MTGGNFEGIGSVLNQKLRVFILYIYKRRGVNKVQGEGCDN